MSATLTLAEILSATEVIAQKEANDKVALEGIGQLDIETLRAKLIQWAVLGFPNVYPVHEFHLVTPPLCSDGVSRILGEYITFCSGKSIQEHVAVLQGMLPDIAVAFCYTGASIQIVVSRTTV